ncbi:hypothetical protein HDU91_004590, partial [Kappamyces sp. JEL0680]
FQNLKSWKLNYLIRLNWEKGNYETVIIGMNVVAVAQSRSFVCLGLDDHGHRLELSKLSQKLCLLDLSWRPNLLFAQATESRCDIVAGCSSVHMCFYTVDISDPCQPAVAAVPFSSAVPDRSIASVCWNSSTLITAGTELQIEIF